MAKVHETNDALNPRWIYWGLARLEGLGNPRCHTANAASRSIVEASFSANAIVPVQSFTKNLPCLRTQTYGS